MGRWGAGFILIQQARYLLFGLEIQSVAFERFSLVVVGLICITWEWVVLAHSDRSIPLATVDAGFLPPHTGITIPCLGYLIDYHIWIAFACSSNVHTHTDPQFH
jgi:hypothetical protein